jgi:serine/threonine protein kinase HipA of HipAB toxin-antitoxin module
MRRYDDPVETRMGQVSGMEGPEQFLWRGRLWKVRAVLAHWVETGPWWQSGGVRAVIGSDQPDTETGGHEPARALGHDLLGERELWRVEAGRGPAADGGGVFELSFDWSDGRWALVGCAD